MYKHKKMHKWKRAQAHININRVSKVNVVNVTHLHTNYANSDINMQRETAQTKSLCMQCCKKRTKIYKPDQCFALKSILKQRRDDLRNSY